MKIPQYDSVSPPYCRIRKGEAIISVEVLPCIRGKKGKSNFFHAYPTPPHPKRARACVLCTIKEGSSLFRVLDAHLYCAVCTINRHLLRYKTLLPRKGGRRVSYY